MTNSARMEIVTIVPEQVIPAVTEAKVTLVLSEQDALNLLAITSAIGGLPSSTGRATFSSRDGSLDLILREALNVGCGYATRTDVIEGDIRFNRHATRDDFDHNNNW